ncbi:MAG TPA: tRNA pseudouridine(55) synthase TruB [Candidatus Saccharimonadales bacterium]|nr:tRNA pseudouridine(55) synthase TruB [Candidatus Saccharimonadales bacterium]
MDGYLLVDKPAGISSFAVVARVRRVLSEAAGHKVKVGHTGTLDPAATGLMILVIGAYCKRASEFSKLDKTYQVEMTLGAVSSTGDIEGEIIKKSVHRPDETEVRLILSKFKGQIFQTPPAFSAIKVNGQRAYKLAREGKEVKIEPRQVTIKSIKNIDYKYPKLSLITEVSSGTYIRSLVEDIGAELGTGAYMSGLCRTKIADHTLTDAVELEGLTKDIIYRNILPNYVRGSQS